MSFDDFIYASLLVFSVLIGSYVSKIKDKYVKKMSFSFIGFAMALIICGHFIWHSLATNLVAFIIFKSVPKRYVHLASLIGCFAYLAFFRTADWWGFLKPSPHSNAVQLLVTLRLIGVAYEIHDSDKLAQEAKKSDDNDEVRLKIRYQSISPSSFDIFLYCYCYVGLLTGPYYRFRTYQDMINQSPEDNIPTTEFLMKRIIYSPFYGVLYLILSQLYHINYAKTDQFYEHSFLYRFYFMILTSFVFRLRMYFAWIMSECVCMAVGLGAYPEICRPRGAGGPGDLAALEKLDDQKSEGKTISVQYSYETIHNIDEWGCEMSLTVRDCMKSWNMSVQYFLAYYIYRRVPSKALRTSVTMAVSAYWHGVHPGYYLSFLTIPLALRGEEALKKLLLKISPEDQIFLAQWGFKRLVYDYCAMGFLFLAGEATLRYWGSIFWFVHIASVLFIVFEIAFSSRETSHESSSAAR